MNTVALTKHSGGIGLVIAALIPVLYRLFWPSSYTLANFWLRSTPSQYHGKNVSTRFFEGWYFKTVTNDTKESVVVIPGIYKGGSGTKENGQKEYGGYLNYEKLSHAFVMVVTEGLDCLYYRYDICEFSAHFGMDGSSDDFFIKIGRNRFRKTNIKLSLPSSRLWRPSAEEFETFLEVVKRDWDRIVTHTKSTSAGSALQLNPKNGSTESLASDATVVESAADLQTDHLELQDEKLDLQSLPETHSSVPKAFGHHPFTAYSVRAYISFKEITPFPSTGLAPSVMGFFQYIPWLECVHGIVSLHHKSHGLIEFINQENNSAVEKRIDFRDGTGYIEKDWGVNFPQTWIWAQSNSFMVESGSSLMLSIADVPIWAGRFHLAGALIVLHHGRTNITYNFSTYTFPRVHALDVSLDESGMQRVQLHVADRSGLNLEVRTRRRAGTGVPLRAPSKAFGKMILALEESIDAEMEVKLWWQGDNEDEDIMVLEDRALRGGLEIVGDVVSLAKKYVGH